jgi:diacylglycerol kinase (ATP)
MVGRGLSKDLRKDLQLEVDGKVIDLPNIKGIIILNIMRSEPGIVFTTLRTQ